MTFQTRDAQPFLQSACALLNIDCDRLDSISESPLKRSYQTEYVGLGV